MEIKSIIDKIKKTTSSPITFAVVFALSIIAQCEVFHYQIFHEFAATSIVKAPKLFFLFHLPKISIALFMTSFVFIFPRKWWTIAISFIMSLWIYANIFYYRVNYAFIDEYSIKLAGNMDGFWNSIFGLIQPSDWIYLGITAIIAAFAISSQTKQIKNTRMFSISMASSIVTGIICGILLNINNISSRNHLNPFEKYEKEMYKNVLEKDNTQYLQEHSIIHLAFYTIINVITQEKEKPVEFSEKEEEFLQLTKTPSDTIHPQTKLIVLLIESFDNFLLNGNTMPNLSNFIASSNNILYAKVQSQIRYGVSGDGQMILETGLLPIREGAASDRFPDNKYPSLFKLYDKSVGIFPLTLKTWNQKEMSQAYGIKKNIVTSYLRDDSLAKQAVECAKEYGNILTVTMSTHLPYEYYNKEFVLSDSPQYPSTLNNYIKNFNVLDKYISGFLKDIEKNEILKNSTIVITGDHAAPFGEDIKSIKSINFENCPLIIYSPSIESKVLIDEECYQMDIFPTILHIIGCDYYYWKGFGVNLLDSAARANRPISAEEAFILSDKLIRANYFEKYEK